jgi:hypothetical protein
LVGPRDATPRLALASRARDTRACLALPSAEAPIVTAAFKIVLNYRRDDAAGHAGHLFEDLEERFGKGNVFMDIVGMQPGVDIPKVIEDAVGSCDAFVAMIGQRWLNAADSQGRRRLDNPKDFVRLEIEAAIWRECALIPVLVQDAEMPSEEDLPPSLAPLARKHALEIRDSSRRYDVDQLIAALERVAAAKGPPPPPPKPPRRRRELPRPSRLVLIAAAALLVALAVLVAVLAFSGDGDGGGNGGGGGGEAEERITFASDAGIFTVSLDGASEPALVEGTEPGDASPDWSADGTRLAVVRDGQIHVVGEDEPLTSGMSAGLPDWSPDGTMVAFSRESGDRPRPHDVWVVATDGSGHEDNLTDEPGESGAVPDWSPDGRRIVYQREQLIYVIPASGARGRKLELEIEGSPRRPKWSPTRAEIAVRVGLGGRWNIHIVDPVTGVDEGNVTRDGFTNPDYPAWSPDGERIVFTADDGIWVVNRDGSGRMRVVSGTGLRHPSWQPSSEG